jgi:hypothetical protein
VTGKSKWGNGGNGGIFIIILKYRLLDESRMRGKWGNQRNIFYYFEFLFIKVLNLSSENGE